MTGRERLVAASRGGDLDCQPIVVWSESPGHVADGICVSMAGLQDALRTHPDQAVLGEILSPIGRAAYFGLDLVQILRDDPERGSEELQKIADDVRRGIERALDLGADGIFYRLIGAMPAMTTPMEYGGHFLEVDRELLSTAQGARINLLWIEGDDEPYLDFVSDLPASLLGWDVVSTGIEIAKVRSMRTGALCGPDAQADVYFTSSFDEAARLRENRPA
ncbi:MAG TPA: hypothetical protein PLO61_04760 [Fimbriimonadaceae bacterium]|nr:hypothetical protein [Fimbriimonadaceae bacterium]HRJ32531.1 hypothetical protein [Fimbriimonadaceae bacterium]